MKLSTLKNKELRDLDTEENEDWETLIKAGILKEVK